MKKTLRILALVLALALTAALFGACAKTGTKTDTKTKATTEPKDEPTDAPVATLNDQLVGKWAADLSVFAELIGEEIPEGVDFSMTMEFKKDGTGEMAMKAAFEGETIADESVGYKWSLDGDKLSIEMDEEDNDIMDVEDLEGEDGTVNVKIEGDKLTLYGENEDETMVFNRVK